MPQRRIRLSRSSRTALAFVVASLLSDTAMALDWRIIQDQIGAQAGLMEAAKGPQVAGQEAAHSGGNCPGSA